MKYIFFTVFIIILSIFFVSKKIDWKTKHRIIKKINHLTLKPNNNDIILCGDSHIELFDFNLLECNKFYNFGISGEEISGLEKRIKKIQKKNIKQIGILIGTNDILRNKSKESIFKDFDSLFSKIDSKQQITIISIYPFASNIKGLITPSMINEYLKIKAFEKGFYFLDVHSQLINDLGFLPDEFTIDGYHLNILGQQKVAQVICEFYKY